MKEKIIPITKQILISFSNSLSEAVGNALEYAPHPRNRMMFGQSTLDKINTQWKQQQKFKRALQDLEKRKFIETRNRGGKIFYLLTSKGITEAFLAKIKSQNTKTIPNQFCIVCFDIPVSTNKTRWALRRFLKMANFKKLQHSIWYTNKDIFDEIKIYVQNIKATEWVRIIKASKIY